LKVGLNTIKQTKESKSISNQMEPGKLLTKHLSSFLTWRRNCLVSYFYYYHCIISEFTSSLWENSYNWYTVKDFVNREGHHVRSSRYSKYSFSFDKWYKQYLNFVSLIKVYVWFIHRVIHLFIMQIYFIIILPHFNI
jgi:hypothetical protein